MPKESMRDRIVEVATNRFLSGGYRGTGVAEIQSAAGTGPGALYHHFGNKEKLLLAVIDRHEDFLRDRLVEREGSEHRDPLERIVGVFDFYADFLAANGCHQGSLAGNLALELSDTHPAVRRRLEDLFGVIRRAIRDWLHDAGCRLPEGTDAQSLATFVIAVLEGGILQTRVSKSLEPFTASLGHLRAYLASLDPSREDGTPLLVVSAG